MGSGLAARDGGVWVALPRRLGLRSVGRLDNEYIIVMLRGDRDTSSGFGPCSEAFLATASGAGDFGPSGLGKISQPRIERFVGVRAAPLAFGLPFASNYFSALTPQGSSANVIFAGSGYLTQGELYKLGALTTGFKLLIFLVVGTPRLLFVAR